MIKNVRQATTKDFQAITQFRSMLIPSIPSNMDEITEYLIQNKRIYVYDSNEVLGYIMFNRLDDTHPDFPLSIFIHDLFVDKKHRQNGIGSDLVSELIKNEESPIYKYFYVTHDQKSDLLVNFYNKHGFVDMKKKYKGKRLLMYDST